MKSSVKSALTTGTRRSQNVQAHLLNQPNCKTVPNRNTKSTKMTISTIPFSQNEDEINEKWHTMMIKATEKHTISKELEAKIDALLGM